MGSLASGPEESGLILDRSLANKAECERMNCTQAALSLVISVSKLYHNISISYFSMFYPFRGEMRSFIFLDLYIAYNRHVPPRYTAGS